MGAQKNFSGVGYNTGHNTEFSALSLVVDDG